MATNILVTQGVDEALLEGSVVADIRVTQAADETLSEGPTTANVRFSQDAIEALTEGQTLRVQTGRASIILVSTKLQTGHAAVQNVTGRSRTGVASIASSVVVNLSDSLTIGITDTSSLTETTPTQPTDSLGIGLLESITVTVTDVVVKNLSDSLSVGCDDSTPPYVLPDGERVDHLVIGLTESLSVSVSGIGGGTSATATPPNIKLPSPRVHESFKAFNADDSQKALFTLRDALLSAGWTITESISALGSIFAFVIPIGGPTPLHRFAFEDNWCFVDGITFGFFDNRPGGDIPDYTIPAFVWVEKGISGDGSPSSDASAILVSFSNLQIAITAFTSFTASINATQTGFDLISKLNGADGNNHMVQGNGGESTGTNSWAGGWSMTSQKANGISDIELRFTLGDLGRVMLACFADDVQLDFGIGALEGTADTRVDGGFHLAQHEYQIYACPYQVLISPATDADDPYFGDIYFENSSLFFCAPWVDPSRVSYCSYAIFGYPSCRQTLQTANCGIRLNGSTFKPVTGISTTCGLAMLLYNQPSEPLHTWNADPTLFQDALVMLSKGTDDYRLVGQPWNCYCQTDLASRGSTGFALFSGVTYPTFALATNENGTIATLWMVT